MKNNLKLINLLVLIFLGISCTNQSNMSAGTSYSVKGKIVKGNGKMVTQSIAVQDYEKIEISGNMILNYSQMDSDAELSITLDENLYDYFNFYVKGTTLIIEPKATSNPIRIMSTRFIVNTHSRMLSKIENNGSCEFVAQTPIQTNKLQIENAGSGSITCMKAVEIGNLQIENAGSGSINLVGRARQASVEVTGSGKINLENCAINECRCEIVGSGDIYVYAVSKLNCKIFGTGNVIYIGKPEIIKEILGTGKVVKR